MEQEINLHKNLCLLARAHALAVGQAIEIVPSETAPWRYAIHALGREDVPDVVCALGELSLEVAKMIEELGYGEERQAALVEQVAQRAARVLETQRPPP